MDFNGERDACGVGFVAHIKGQRSRAIVDQGLEVLRRLSHRAACGADPDTGDGAGILLQLPEKFLRGEGERLGFDLPKKRFAVGNVFLPPDPDRKSTRLNSSHVEISYAVFCLKKKK